MDGQSKLEVGDLIGYHPNEARWYMATVFQVGAGSVEVDFVWGARGDVPLGSVTKLQTRVEQNAGSWEMTAEVFREALGGVEAIQAAEIHWVLACRGLAIREETGGKLRLERVLGATVAEYSRWSGAA